MDYSTTMLAYMAGVSLSRDELALSSSPPSRPTLAFSLSLGNSHASRAIPFVVVYRYAADPMRAICVQG